MPLRTTVLPLKLVHNHCRQEVGYHGHQKCYMAKIHTPVSQVTQDICAQYMYI